MSNDTTITDRDIAALRIEADQAGDLAMSALCVLALGGRDALDGAEPGTEQHRLHARGTTQEHARSECEWAIIEGQG